MSQKIFNIKIDGEDFDDVLSAISYTLDNYPKAGAKEFRRDLKHIFKRLWNIRVEKENKK